MPSLHIKNAQLEQQFLSPESVSLGLTLDELRAEEREVLLQLGALIALLRAAAERVPVRHFHTN